MSIELTPQTQFPDIWWAYKPFRSWNSGSLGKGFCQVQGRCNINKHLIEIAGSSCVGQFSDGLWYRATVEKIVNSQAHILYHQLWQLWSGSVLKTGNSSTWATPSGQRIPSCVCHPTHRWGLVSGSTCCFQQRNYGQIDDVEYWVQEPGARVYVSVQNMTDNSTLERS